MGSEQNNLPSNHQPAPGNPRTASSGVPNAAAVSADHNQQKPGPMPQPALTPKPTSNVAEGQPPSKKDNLRSILSTILLLAIAPLIALSVTAFAIQSYQVDGESMEPTLQNHDRLIVDKVPRTIAHITGHNYIPQRGDIIIFNEANLPDSSVVGSKQLIKRVIGLPGERVVVKEGHITVYNKANPDGFNPDARGGWRTSSSETSGNVTVTLAKDQIFVCGDNRPNSEDSRFFGPVDAKDIVGKLVLRVFPLDKAQTF